MQQTETKCREELQLKGVKTRQKQETNGSIDPGKITATTIIGDKVRNSQGEDLGKIEEVMLDLNNGTITYLVVSTGGVFGIGDKLFAIPLDSLTLDVQERVFYLQADKATLKKARGFNKNDWPREAVWPEKKQT